ncbi:MAG: glycosyltransferase family 4 protein, partial [Candidatus Bathyanammoxibius sp.]
LLKALRHEAGKGPVLFFLIGIKGKWTVFIPLFIKNVPIVMQQLTEGTGYSRARLKKRPWLLPLSVLEHMAYKNVDRFFLLFGRAKEEMKRYVEPERLDVIPSGKDFELFRPTDRNEARDALGLDTKKHYILFVGRINDRKGVRYLIEAMPGILEEYPATELLLVGPARREEILSGLKDLTRLRGLDQHVRFMGPIENDRLPPFYNASDVFVLPSTTEGFPFVLLEAAGCNTPVVATEVGGIPEFMQMVKKGIMVPPCSPEDIAQAVKSVFRGPELYNNRLRDGVLQYSWESLLSKTVDVFEELRGRYFPDDTSA